MTSLVKSRGKHRGAEAFRPDPLDSRFDELYLRTAATDYASTYDWTVSGDGDVWVTVPVAEVSPGPRHAAVEYDPAAAYTAALRLFRASLV